MTLRSETRLPGKLDSRPHPDAEEPASARRHGSIDSRRIADMAPRPSSARHRFP